MKTFPKKRVLQSVKIVEFGLTAFVKFNRGLNSVHDHLYLIIYQNILINVRKMKRYSPFRSINTFPHLTFSNVIKGFRKDSPSILHVFLKRFYSLVRRNSWSKEPTKNINRKLRLRARTFDWKLSVWQTEFQSDILLSGRPSFLPRKKIRFGLKIFRSGKLRPDKINV